MWNLDLKFPPGFTPVLGPSPVQWEQADVAMQDIFSNTCLVNYMISMVTICRSCVCHSILTKNDILQRTQKKSWIPSRECHRESWRGGIAITLGGAPMMNPPIFNYYTFIRQRVYCRPNSSVPTNHGVGWMDKSTVVSDTASSDCGASNGRVYSVKLGVSESECGEDTDEEESIEFPSFSGTEITVYLSLTIKAHGNAYVVDY